MPMSGAPPADHRPEFAGPLPADEVLHVRDTCLCFATQRLARRLARRFDAAFRPLGITNNQFSLMMRLNLEKPVTLSQLADFLGMDQTTMSAALKALERAGLLAVVRDEKDKRIRRPVLTPKGYETVHAALPIWRAEHAALEREAPPGEAARLRAALTAFAPARAPSTTPSTPDADNRS